jgi:hypothetical protein
MALGVYRRHKPEDTTLYRVVKEGTSPGIVDTGSKPP